MESKAKEKIIDKSLWIGSAKSFFKIVLFVVCLFFYLISVLFYFAPKFDAKLFNFFGLFGAEERCYEQIYKNSGSTSDLYNLIVFEMNKENYFKEAEYIEKIFKAKDYSDFCKKLDESGVDSANGNKSLYPLVADTNSFLMCQEVKCRVMLGLKTTSNNWKNNIANSVRENLSGENLTETTLETYLNLIFKSNLSKNDKQNIALELKGDEGDSSKTLNELIELRITKITDKLNGEGVSEVQRILLKNAEVKLYKAGYYFEVMLNGGEESDAATVYKTDYERALNEYKLLIK